MDNNMKVTLTRSKLLAVVAVTAFVILMMELLLARMYVFFIGNVSSFIAIPITMLGLSIGTLILHWQPQIVKEASIKLLVGILLFSLIVSFFGFFYMFNHYFGLSNWYDQNPVRDAGRTMALTLIFIPSFALGGMLLSIVFKLGADRIGRLYATDLAGSASACIITILILHYFGLAAAITSLLTLPALLLVFIVNGNRKIYALIVMAISISMYIAGNHREIFTEEFDNKVLAGYFLESDEAAQVKYRWDEVSRVSLVHYGNPENPYKIHHDDGVSTVYISRYEPEKVNLYPKSTSLYELPFLLDKKISSALVLFAGVGKDMVKLNEYASGDIEITGIELSRLVPWIVTTPPYDLFNLKAFYQLPNIHYRVDEGRAFLGRSQEQYDMIFIATNGATVSTRFGDTRKYLDTYEALGEMLDHLSPDGVLYFYSTFFHNERLEALKKLFQEHNYAPLKNSIIRFGGWGQPNLRDTYMVKPSGFSSDEVIRIVNYINKRARETLWYAPGASSHPVFKQLYESPYDKRVKISIDNRPYPRTIDFAGFSLFPDEKIFSDITYGPENAAQWLKILTMFVFIALAVLIIVCFYAVGPRQQKLPFTLFSYFMITGICYMLVQISMISKLELFFGQPLYSMMIVLTSFLAFNALGAYFVNWWNGNKPDNLSATMIALTAVVVTPVCFLITEQLVHLIGFNLIYKSVLAIISLSPLAFVLGMFYPVGVKLTVDKKLDELIPMTFGLATLSSVIGGVFTLVLVINLGFWNMILLAVVGYLMLTLIMSRSA